jgi:signal transduction histidine kinase
MCAVKRNAGIAGWSRRYQGALGQHLKQGPGASLRPAHELGREAVALGFETLSMARIHQQALTTAASPGGSSRTRQRRIGRARRFFAETLVPIEQTHRAALEADVLLNQLARTLRRRTAESSASTRHLKQSIIQRQGAELALKKSGKRHARLLAELRRLQKHLRDLTHAFLSTQEDERQRMSLRLHDDIAQALIAIDLRLLTLRKAGRASAASLKKEIANTQELVKESGKRIHQFAHEFGTQHEP